MESIISFVVIPLYGKWPVTRAKIIIPIAHTSIGGPIFFKFYVNISGGIYINDPAVALSI